MPERHHHNFKHGQARPESRGPTYRSWECMRSRCRNPNNPDYARYGARGITVCERWNSFQVFLEDMGERPQGTTLDRIEVNGNYEPGNCRWATPREQQRNKSTGTRVTFRGAVVSIKELSEMTGQPYQRLHERIIRRGWDAEKAVSAPPKAPKQWGNYTDLITEAA